MKTNGEKLSTAIINQAAGAMWCPDYIPIHRQLRDSLPLQRGIRHYPTEFVPIILMRKKHPHPYPCFEMPGLRMQYPRSKAAFRILFVKGKSTLCRFHRYDHVNNAWISKKSFPKAKIVQT